MHRTFTADLQVEKKGGKKINPKRMRRIIEKEMARNATHGAPRPAPCLCASA